MDTNVLVRAATGDNPTQARAAGKLLREAELIAISVSCLCELVWVLRDSYRFRYEDVLASLESLLAASNVIVDRLAVEAGLAMMREGGDFADGVIAFDGRRLGGQTFVSFDRNAVLALRKQGEAAQIPS